MIPAYRHESVHFSSCAIERLRLFAREARKSKRSRGNGWGAEPTLPLRIFIDNALAVQ